MRHEFRLADIGEGLEEAEIVTWLVGVGDTVARDEPLVEVLTDKSNAELPAPWSGTVVALGGAVGDMISVGDVVAVIDEQAAAAGAPSGIDEPGAFGSAVRPSDSESTFFAAATGSAGPPPVAAAPEPAHAPDPSRDLDPQPQRAKASPTTRREAAKRGIDLATVAGSGPGGRVLLTDLDQASGHTAPDVPVFDVSPARTAPSAQSDAAPRPKTSRQQRPSTQAAVNAAGLTAGEHPLRGIRRRIAQNMTASWSEIPHIHAWREIDAEPLMQLRDRLRESGRVQYATLTPLAFFVSAVAHGLRTFPVANASLNMETETITVHPEVNIGIAVASPQGLVVPVINGADQMSLTQTSSQIRQLVTQAREGSLGSEAFRDGTATITNFGSLGGENATPIIRPPESVIVGFGSIAARPFVHDGQVQACRTMHVVVGADHRLLDGDVTTAFLNHVCEQLIDPIDLALGL